MERQESSGYCDSESDADPELRVRMLGDDDLREFWEFATTVRRTRSLADRASKRLRGTWLTPSLAVQRVHGWGPRSVRLLCVHVASAERREKLRLFFQRDRRNLEGQLLNAQDPLDGEERVLLKVPYNQSLGAWVQRERQVLRELEGIEGVPVLFDRIYFEDIDIHAATYRYSGACSLQEQLERGHLMAPEDLHRVLSFVLATLRQVHARGWLHTDLHPKDLLLPAPRLVGDESSQSVTVPAAPALICGWTHATANTSGPAGAAVGALLELLPLPQVPRSMCASGAAEPSPTQEELPVGAVDAPATLEVPEVPEAPEESETTGAAPDAGVAPGISLYSAPEQLVGIFLGQRFATPATDVYRAAGVALAALRARGPLGSPMHLVEPSAERCMDSIRKLCHEALLSRSKPSVESQQADESGGPSSPPLAEPDHVKAFAHSLKRLLRGAVNVSGGHCQELEGWFRACLAREPSERPQTTDEALEALDAAWSVLEVRMLEEARAKQALASPDRSSGETPTRKPRIVLETPPELASMHVL